MNNISSRNVPSTPLSSARKSIKVPGLVSLSSSSNKKKIFYNSSKFGDRKAKRLNGFTIEFEPGFVRPEAFGRFLENVLQYLLYDSNVMAMPYQYFERFYRQPDGPKLMNVPNELRFFEMYDSLGKMFTMMHRLLAQQMNTKIAEIALCFGDSFHYVREVFVFDLSKLNFDLDADNAVYLNRKSLPTLPLNYLVKTFFRKLLNEIYPEMEANMKGANNTRNKRVGKNAVFLSVKTRFVDLPELEKYIDAQQELFDQQDDSPNKTSVEESFGIDDYRCRFRASIVANSYRLGSTMTKRTTFTFEHPPLPQEKEEAFNKLGAEQFKVFVEGQAEEEIIEEDEVLDNVSLANDSTSTNASELDDDDEIFGDDIPMSQASADEVMDDSQVWVQICEPILCHSKLL